jgi:2-methylisocitrate lyase-like PEP mutase family enzyme
LPPHRSGVTALDRLRAARHAIDQSGENVLRVAGTDILVDEPAALSAAVDKLMAFAGAGADCLDASGVKRKGRHSVIVQAIFETVAGSPEPPERAALDSIHVKARELR